MSRTFLCDALKGAIGGIAVVSVVTLVMMPKAMDPSGLRPRVDSLERRIDSVETQMRHKVDESDRPTVVVDPADLIPPTKLPVR